VANPEIVSRPAMIWSAIPAGNEGSGPHALASSAAVIAVIAVPPAGAACAGATPLKPAKTARATAPATQAVLFTVETIPRRQPASWPFPHRHKELTGIVTNTVATEPASPKPYPGVPARWRMLRRATAMIVLVGFTAPDVTNAAPSAT
jgi:hypothetical protein